MFFKLDQNNKLNQLRQIKREIGWNLYDFKRTLMQQQLLSKVVNKKEIRVVGLRRTGNHGIINWIKSQNSGEVWHLNNILVKQNPYRVNYHHFPEERWRREALGNFSLKECLIYSYEDWSLEQIADPHFEKKHDLYFGKSETRYDILILRDPFNLLASRFKRNYMNVKENHQTVEQLWIAYAKEFLGQTQHLKYNKICINYNQWFLDVEYRKQISEKLGLQFSDEGFSKVKGGGGSSFDSRNYDGQAYKMDVQNRWKVFADDENYLKLLKNEEILEYSKRIFDHISETEILF